MHTPTAPIPFVPKAPSADLAVLIVDDEKSTCSLCADIAREAGMEVYSAESTEAALEILDRSPVDILLTDLKVPELGGLELLKHVRTGATLSLARSVLMRSCTSTNAIPSPPSPSSPTVIWPMP